MRNLKFNKVITLLKNLQESKMNGTFKKVHVKPSEEMKMAGRIQKEVISKASKIYRAYNFVALFGGFSLITLEKIS